MGDSEQKRLIKVGILDGKVDDLGRQNDNFNHHAFRTISEHQAHIQKKLNAEVDDTQLFLKELNNVNPRACP